MGMKELALLVAADQFAQALGAYLGDVTPPPANPWLKSLVAVGQELAANAHTALQAGIAAAAAELGTALSQESAVASVLQTLPPIT